MILLLCCVFGGKVTNREKLILKKNGKKMFSQFLFLHLFFYLFIFSPKANKSFSIFLYGFFALRKLICFEQ